MNQDVIREIIKYLNIKDLENLIVNHNYQTLIDNQIKDNFCNKFQLKPIDANYRYLTYLMIEVRTELSDVCKTEQVLSVYLQNDVEAIKISTDRVLHNLDDEIWGMYYITKELLQKVKYTNSFINKFAHSIASQDLTKILTHNNLFVHAIDHIFDQITNLIISRHKYCINIEYVLDNGLEGYGTVAKLPDLTKFSQLYSLEIIGISNSYLTIRPVSLINLTIIDLANDDFKFLEGITHLTIFEIDELNQLNNLPKSIEKVCYYRTDQIINPDNYHFKIRKF